MTAILGLSAYYHDSAACLVIDGEIVAAAQEERFTRKKHDHAFPAKACRWCLTEAGLAPGDLDYVAFYDKPLVKFERLLETYLDYVPLGFGSFLRAMPLWMKEKLWLPDLIRSELARLEGADHPKEVRKRAASFQWKVLFGDHHESHAASAFYPSPFEEAAVVTIDGVGEWATASVGMGRGRELVLLKELRFPDSLGLLYSAFTYFTGFKVNSGEYKVMGLAPYGEPKYVEDIKRCLVEVRDDGSIRLNQKYFTYCHRLRMTGRAFERLFRGPARTPESQLTQREMDLARSVQDVTEEIMLKIAKFAHRETGLRHLALAVWHRYLGHPRRSAEASGAWRPCAKSRPNGDEGLDRAHSLRTVGAMARAADLPPYADAMKGSYLGPRFTSEQIGRFLEGRRLPAERLVEHRLADEVAERLAAQQVVGLFQGRMEFGPRALGARSILGDPRSPHMQSVMNLKIKYRESFRPFAPSVLREHVADWFDLDGDSPYMLLVAEVRKTRQRAMTADERGRWGIDKLKVPRSEIPAVTHVDYSARIQTVRREMAPLFWEILDAFNRLTGCPVLVNTSFNVRGEPIVCTPEDAYRCFMRTQMDALVLETFLLDKTHQPPFEERGDWRREFAPD